MKRSPQPPHYVSERWSMKQLLFVLIVSSVTAFAQTPGCTPPPAHVTSWWTFDETSGTTAHDVAGATKNDGAHAGAVALTAGEAAGPAADAASRAPNCLTASRGSGVHTDHKGANST